MLSLAKVQEYHSKRRKIPSVILENVHGSDAVYGARALNAQLPRYLNMPTQDYDIMSTTPKHDAHETEHSLDKMMGFNAFKVEDAKHKGTYRVRSNVDGVVYADYSKKPKKIPTTTIRGKKYVKLSWHEMRARKVLADKEAKYRHAKDRGTLMRIKLYKTKKKK